MINRPFPALASASLAVLLALSACGQTGPLTLPDPADKPASEASDKTPDAPRSEPAP